MMSVIEMTLEGAVIIAVIILVRSLTIHRLPKKAFLLLWAVALIRLLVPVRITSPASIYSVTPGITFVRRSGVLQAEAAQAASVSSGSGAMSLSLWTVVWLAVGLLLALGILICHIKNRQIYRTSLPVESPPVKRWMESHRLRRPVFVRCSDQTEAPLTYGVLWPVILLPANMDWTDETLLGFVLAHEMAHIRRFDALTKWFLAAALCLHWFNPLVWVMYILAGRDMELTCDESVLRLYGRKSRADYALALVNMEEQRTSYAPLASSFCRSALKERITAIMKSPGKSVISLAAAGALIGIVIIVFATSAPAENTSAREPQNAASGTQDRSFSSTARAEAVSDDARSVSRETVEETVLGQSYPDSPSYTAAQYNDLMKKIKPEGYEDMSIARFNSKIYALLSGDNEEDSILFEQILTSIPDDDPNAAYVCNTVQASLGEYTARLEEVFSGKQNDPMFYGTAEREIEENVFGDQVITGSRYVSYEFSYRILDQDKLTVRERDAFLQAVIRAVQEQTEKNTSETFTKEKLQDILTAAGENAANEKISFTGGEITEIESY